MRNTLIALAIFISCVSPATAGACTSILKDLAFCAEGKWDRVDVDLPEGMLLWRKPGITAKMMAQGFVPGSVPDPSAVMAAIKNSVRASQDDPEAVSFTKHQIREGKRFDRGIIAYDLVVEGNPVRMHHSFMLAEQALIQFVTHSRAADEAANLAAHRDFITSFKVIEGQQDA